MRQTRCREASTSSLRPGTPQCSFPARRRPARISPPRACASPISRFAHQPHCPSVARPISRSLGPTVAPPISRSAHHSLRSPVAPPISVSAHRCLCVIRSTQQSLHARVAPRIVAPRISRSTHQSLRAPVAPAILATRHLAANDGERSIITRPLAKSPGTLQRHLAGAWRAGCERAPGSLPAPDRTMAAPVENGVSAGARTDGAAAAEGRPRRAAHPRMDLP